MTTRTMDALLSRCRKTVDYTYSTELLLDLAKTFNEKSNEAASEEGRTMMLALAWVNAEADLSDRRPVVTVDAASRGYKNMHTAEIDVMRPNGRHGPLRWTFHLCFEKEPTARGIDHRGNRACGEAAAAILSDSPRETKRNVLVDIGSVIETDCGNYRVEWLKQGSYVNHDHLRLVPV